tara:strand:- start:270 stop:647 length:378 start_codon:yes stop_codon:yes gene_type:complete
MKNLQYANLNKTWFIDIDGTIIKHNSHLKGQNVLLDSVKDFWNSISEKDKIILVTNRNKKYKKETTQFLKKNNLRFDNIIFEVGSGQRILINDTKPSGLQTAFSFNIKRDYGFKKLLKKLDVFFK